MPLPTDAFVAFLKNSMTGEAFMAPCQGASVSAAEEQLRTHYPSAVYALQALQPAAALVRFLDHLSRQPQAQAPSKPQPKLADLLATQRIRTHVGGLPPLGPRQVPQPAAPQPLDASHLAHIKTIAKGMPAETQALAARLLAGKLEHEAPQPMLEARITATTTPAKAPLMPSASAANGSLKAALQAMRGEVPAMPATPALPASARGVADVQAEPTSATPFAVGRVSAIHVLKALRTR